MTIFRIGIWVAAAVLAVFIGLSSYVVANQLKAPQRAYALGIRPAADAGGNFAYALFYGRQAKSRKATVTPAELELASQAYRAAPLALSALAVIAETKRGAGDTALRADLLQAAGKLSRRSNAITAQLVELAALQQDEQAFFVWLSRAALTDNNQRDVYVRAMALGTARPGALEALTPILGRNPAWADFYWLNVAAMPDSLVNAAQMRIAIARRPWGRSAVVDNDRRLLRALVRHGEFATAKNLVTQLAPAAARGDRRNLLSNGEFSRQPLLPPFDWELAASGDLGSTIVEKEAALLVSAIGGARGMAARQLVELSGGAYDVNWTLGDDGAGNQSTLAVRLACAEPGRADAVRFVIPSGKGSQRVSLPAGGCTWYWFTITAELADNAPGIDVYLRDIALTRAGSTAAVAGR
ncbi:MAG: hypothetical protein HEQ22_07360 [Sphingopyxis sp.]|uniref:hypothetical protein n=1 Tax=Sphingopyxis sp. TaxID=1908224 RepID=UPI003D80FE33